MYQRHKRLLILGYIPLTMLCFCLFFWQTDFAFSLLYGKNVDATINSAERSTNPSFRFISIFPHTYEIFYSWNAEGKTNQGLTRVVESYYLSEIKGTESMVLKTSPLGGAYPPSFKTFLYDSYTAIAVLCLWLWTTYLLWRGRKIEHNSNKGDE